MAGNHLRGTCRHDGSAAVLGALRRSGRPAAGDGQRRPPYRFGMREPTASRPYMPGYGVVAETEGMLPWSWAQERLERAHDYWVATVWPDGRPHVMPVWGAWFDGCLWFSSDGASRKARNLAANPACTRTRQNRFA